MTAESRAQLRQQLEEKVVELRKLLSEGEQLDLRVFPGGWDAEVIDARGHTLVQMGE